MYWVENYEYLTRIMGTILYFIIWHIFCFEIFIYNFVDFVFRTINTALIVMWKDFKKLKLLLWKNLLIQKRHPIQSFIELLLPAIMACVMVMFRSWVQPVEFNTVTRYEPFNISVPPLILGYRHG